MPENLRPTGDLNTLWEVYSYTNIDDNVLTGSTSGRGTEAQQAGKDDNEEQGWTFGATTYSNVSAITVHVDFGFKLNDEFEADSCNLILTIDSVEEANVFRATNGAIESWVEFSATGSWTQAQIATMNVKADYGSIDNNDEDGYIYVIYAAVTEGGGGGGGTNGGAGAGNMLVNAIRVGTKIKN